MYNNYICDSCFLTKLPWNVVNNCKDDNGNEIHFDFDLVRPTEQRFANGKVSEKQC